jgi:hypothetical protein
LADIFINDKTIIIEVKKGRRGILYRTIAPKFPAVSPMEKAKNSEKDKQKIKRG